MEKNNSERAVFVCFNERNRVEYDDHSFVLLLIINVAKENGLSGSARIV